MRNKIKKFCLYAFILLCPIIMTYEPATDEPEIIIVEPEPLVIQKPVIKKTIIVHQEKMIEEEPKYIEFDVPENSGFKSYMSYRAITSKSSDQYILQHEEAYTGDFGIRQVGDRYCVALGSHFTSEIGTEFDLVLENGEIIPCVLSDQKADKDTDEQNIVTVHNGCLSEFVVDTKVLDKTAKRMGDISYCKDEWDSPVVKIRVYEEKEN